MTKKYIINTAMIQNMLIDSIYASSTQDREIPTRDRERIETFLIELNSLCTQENGYTLKITVEA